MYCTKCGKEMSQCICNQTEGNIQEEFKEQQQVQQFSYEQQVNVQPPQKGLSQIIKEAVVSTKGKVTVILLSLMLLGQLINAFIPVDMSYVSDYMKQLGMTDAELAEMAALFSNMDIAMKAGSVVSLIPMILFVVGAWMLLSACGKKEGEVSVSGLSMMQGVEIYRLVTVCITFAGIGILILVFGALGVSLMGEQYADAGTAVKIVMVVIFTLFVLIMIPVIIYYAKLISMLGRLKKALRTGEMKKNIPVYVVVILAIIGGFSAIGSLGSVVSNTMVFGAMGLVMALGNALTAAAYISATIWLSSLRSQIEQCQRIQNPIY